MLTSIPKNKFYVYMYIRSKDSSISIAGTPYYIGKGCGKRAWDKRRNAKTPKDNKNIIMFETNMTEVEAYAVEEALVLKYGRINNHTGILRNFTDGGVGTVGRIVTEEQRKRYSESKLGDKNPYGMLGKHHSEETKKIMHDKNIGELNPQFGKHHSEETRKLMSERGKGKQLGILRGPQTPEHIAKNSGENHSMWGKKQKTSECPHCGKVGGRTMVRWHFDKCREKPSF